MASDNDTVDAWTWAAMEPPPTDKERELYDRFAEEFIVDQNATLAASRCGFQAGFAVDYGKLLITKAYVQRKISALRMRPPDTKADREYDRTLTINTLRSVAADPYQKGAARVAAASKLALLHGFNAPTRSQVDINGSRGGVVVLPGIASIDEWEKAAEASQKQLAEDSRVT